MLEPCCGWNPSAAGSQAGGDPGEYSPGQVWCSRHLVTALAATLLAVCWNECAKWLAYLLAWPALKERDLASLWIIVALACFGHLRMVGLLLALAVVATSGCSGRSSTRPVRGMVPLLRSGR